MKIKKAVNIILNETKSLESYVYHRATTGSVYIKFKDDRLRSIRVADHKGKQKYRYKWNLRMDIKESYVSQKEGVRRFYFPLTKSGIKEMLQRIKKYNNTIQEADASLLRKYKRLLDGPAKT